MSDFTSASQQKFLALIAAGSTATEAAAATGVHRNTVLNWLRSPAFAETYQRACRRRAAAFTKHAEAIAIESFAAIRAIVTDPQMPPAVRLKAALAMIDRAGATLAAPLEALPEEEVETVPEPQPGPQPPAEDSPAVSAPLENLPNFAQPQPVRSLKIGRNELCPCGSGIKHKRCCLGKPAQPATQAA
jgi:hypothetical protein